MTIIVYRSKSASFAAQRVAKAAPAGMIRAVQEDNIGHIAPGDVVVRWDCYRDDGNVPLGAVDLNPASAVQAARDKAGSRRIFAELAPTTWQNQADIQLPCVIRPAQHKAAKKFFVCRDISQVRTAIRRCGRGWYASRLISKRREFRVFIVQGRVVAVSERFPANPGDIAWNLAVGGRLVNVQREEWPLPVLRAAIEACRRLGLGFAAIDACIDESDVPWVFEANTSPALKNKYTIGQIAKALAACRSEVPAVKAGAKSPKGWKGYIHPALREKTATPEDAATAPQPATPNPQVRPVQPPPPVASQGATMRVFIPATPPPPVIDFTALPAGQPFVFEEAGEQRLGIKAASRFLDYRDTAATLRDFSASVKILRTLDTLRAE